MVKKIIKNIKENAAKKKMSSGTRKTARAALSSAGKKINSNDLFALIEKEAYYLYEKRGAGHGNDQNDWYLAEKKVKTSLKK